LRATVAALGDVSVAELTVDHVLEHAATGRNTFYVHFAGVPVLLEALHQWASARIGDLLAEAGASDPTPIEQLRAVAEAWIRSATSDPVVVCTLLLGAPASKGEPPALEPLSARITHVVLGALRLGIVARRPDPRRVGLVAGSYWIAGVRAAAGAPNVDSMASDLVDITLRAFR
jgi:AcrR family transcriptional regulator